MQYQHMHVQLSTLHLIVELLLCFAQKTKYSKKYQKTGLLKRKSP